MVWAEDEPAEDVLDLGVTVALVDRMRKPRQEREGGGLVRPGAAEYSVIEGAAGDGSPEARERVETVQHSWAPAARPWRGGSETPPGDRRGTAAAYAAVEGYAKPSTGRTRAAGSRKNVAGAGRHAEPLVRFLCTSLGCTIAGHAGEGDGFIAVTAELSAVVVVEASNRRGTGGEFRVPRAVLATRISRARRRTCGPRAGAQEAPGGGRCAGLGDSNRERSRTPA